MYDQNKLIQILTTPEYRCLDGNGKCFPPSNPMYIRISEKMKEVDTYISPKHVYTILNTDRRGMYTSVLKTFDLSKNIENSLNESGNISFPDYSPARECPNKLLDNKSFKLIISDKNWNDVKSVAKHYNNRRYLKLKPGEWSNVFAAKIWEQVKLPCAFTLKNATVFPSLNAKCFVRFNAI